MALSDITFERNKQGLGRTALGSDHITGLVFFNSTALPSGFDNKNIKQIGSVSQAETLGIIEGVEHYHISEFFRINPNALLYVAIYTDEEADFSKIKEVQAEADGTIKQIGVYTTEDFDVALVSQLNTIAKELDDEHAPLSVVLAANISDITNLPDLSASLSNKVSVIVGQDGGNKGQEIYSTTGKSVTALGALMGAISRASVHESIAWVQEFDMQGSELGTLAFADGSSYKSYTKAQLDALNDKRYIFLQKHIGLNGSYFNSSFSADISDLDSIEKNRTIDKAVRGVRTALLPRLNSPIYVDENGKLSVSTILVFDSLASRPLAQMEAANELSGFSINIDPAQDVLGTDTIELSLELQPVGVARMIRIKIGFVANFSTNN